jgi:predicted helicase
LEVLLHNIRETSTSEKDKGTKFELLMLAFFRTEPTYKAQFNQVWMWSDWPGNKGLPDTGIDLVAENIEGGFTAIQCKNFAPTTTLDKSDIDSFFNESGKAPFTHRIIVSTTNLWSVHAENSLKGQDKPVRRIGIDALNNSMVDWDSLSIDNLKKMRLFEGKKRREHQVEAIEAAMKGFETHDRGKLIMACGTGKTYVAQCIGEDLVGLGGSVLVLVPSISLLSQTVKEWTADSSISINVFAVCSDSKAGRRRESEDMAPYDLAIPATTDTKLLLEKFTATKSKNKMNVILSTYQSIDIVQKAQEQGLGKFDLIIADEAHRTTGVTLMGEEDSAFTRVHDDKYLAAKKRLYMTATPRVYGDSAKAKANAAEAWLASMDDYDTFGEEFYRLGFAEAVNRDLLTDYKVLVLTVNEDAVASAFQQQLSDSNHELKLDDATRIVGCLNAFAKHDPTGKYFTNDNSPMKRVVAFSNTINNSKKFKELFSEVSDRFKSYTDNDLTINVAVDHVDGSFNSLKRDNLLGWLKAEPAPSYCHVLSNARCLTEGVDVPSLDAIVFLEPRNSMVDVVQAVGRVMRKSANKQYGYVILPIGIPAGITPEEALSDNKRYAGVWQVLNALRSHDERINAVVNKLDLNNEAPDMIEIVPVGFKESEEAPANDAQTDEKPRQLQIEFPLEEIRQAIFAKMVEKVGSRQYWETWAKDVAQIAERHVKQIEALLDRRNTKVSREFAKFLSGLQGSLNSKISRDDAIEMLAQHLITKPIFDAVFGDFEFGKRNPVSIVMQGMIDLLEDKVSDSDLQILDKFYADVRQRAEGIDNLKGKQKIIAELYEKFFKFAFPKTAQRLGIVYTPIEVVDFMINSIDEILKNEFNSGISEENVHLLDPFTGTGTFVTRLLQSDLISDSDLIRKYRKEIHANELVLLAYYIAAINIESSFHERIEQDYSTFEGVVLTDTFQMYEDDDVIDEEIFTHNSERAIKQKETPIKVIFGNPPYSVGQQSENDNNVNLRYPFLDARIESTYVKNSTSTLRRNLYDSYIRAFRWATDRIDGNGLICFVTNGSWIDSKSADGFRKSLQQEFNKIYVLNLRGNQRTQGEISRMEGGKIFGEGSRTPVAITILVRNPKSSDKGTIKYFDIGDFLSREEKLKRIQDLESIGNVIWDQITPNEQGDWINKRSSHFEKFLPIGEKKSKTDMPIFSFYSMGVVTSRDAWVYNSSQADLVKNVKSLIDTYEEYRKDYSSFVERGKGKRDRESLSEFLIDHSDPVKISWSRALKTDLLNDIPLKFDQKNVVIAMYRPFYKQNFYFDRRLNEVIGLNKKVYPNSSLRNKTICVMGPGANKKFSVIATDVVPNFHLVDTGQTFPMYHYAKEETDTGMLEFEEGGDGFTRYESISDIAKVRFENSLGEKVSKEDIFYYIYGLLHSSQYTETFKNDLKKMLPRIPIVQQFKDFSRAGQKLMDLHIGYESVEIFNVEGLQEFRDAKLSVKTLKLDRKQGSIDRTRLIVNGSILLSGIPEEAYEYQLNGQPVLMGFIDRYQVTENSVSKQKNDPNLYSEQEHYVINLFARLISVSLESTKLIKGLPRLDFPS